jgi:hypothetical protein
MAISGAGPSNQKLSDWADKLKASFEKLSRIDGSRSDNRLDTPGLVEIFTPSASPTKSQIQLFHEQETGENGQTKETMRLKTLVLDDQGTPRAFSENVLELEGDEAKASKSKSYIKDANGEFQVVEQSCDNRDTRKLDDWKTVVFKAEGEKQQAVEKEISEFQQNWLLSNP